MAVAAELNALRTIAQRSLGTGERAIVGAPVTADIDGQAYITLRGQSCAGAGGSLGLVRDYFAAYFAALGDGLPEAPIRRVTGFGERFIEKLWEGRGEVGTINWEGTSWEVSVAGDDPALQQLYVCRVEIVIVDFIN